MDKDTKYVLKLGALWIALQVMWGFAVVVTLTVLNQNPSTEQLMILAGLPYFVVANLIIIDMIRKR